MEQFVFDVMYKATVIDVTVVSAETEEEAIEKIKNGDIDDVIDRHIEEEEMIDIIR